MAGAVFAGRLETGREIEVGEEDAGEEVGEVVENALTPNYGGQDVVGLTDDGIDGCHGEEDESAPE